MLCSRTRSKVLQQAQVKNPVKQAGNPKGYHAFSKHDSLHACLQAAAESDMLTELQWRVAALEALHAFVIGPCTRCAPLQAATLIATCTSLLQPTLDAICAAPALQVMSSSSAPTPAYGRSPCNSSATTRHCKCSNLEHGVVETHISAHPQPQVVLSMSDTSAQMLSVTLGNVGGGYSPCRLDQAPQSTALQDPWRSGSGSNSAFAGAAALLQLRLLQAYLLLPKAAAFAPDHASILRLCASALKGTSGPSGTPLPCCCFCFQDSTQLF